MSAGPGRNSVRAIGIAVAVAILLVDQLIKYAVVHILHMPERFPPEIRITSFFNISWTQNRGVSMGFFTADTEVMRWLLVGMTALIASVVAVWLWRERSRDDALGLGLILGGALGNIVDRVRLGYVVDYADLHIGAWRPFLIFNLADAAITFGVLILLARALLLREKAGQQAGPKESH